jgi:predicted O-methyltransferase YrrM
MTRAAAEPSAALRYVGDLSAADAALLAELAAGARRILEYGVGASTQVFAQAAAAGSEIVGLDRDRYWIERTRSLLAELAPGREVRLVQFDRLAALDAFADGSFDLVFDDGEDDLRLEFALAAWRLVPVGGRLVLHDTRRPRDAGNALAVVFRYFREIGRVDLNPGNTNLAILHKVAPRPRPAVRKR